MDNNLSRILYEVTNNIQWGNDAYGNPPPYSFYDFTQSTDTAYNLGMQFVRFYEKPQTITPLRRYTGRILVYLPWRNTAYPAYKCIQKKKISMGNLCKEIKGTKKVIDLLYFFLHIDKNII